MLWHGNECGKYESNENFKTTIPSNNYDRPKTTGECGMF
jgi:spore coat protein CotF